MRICVAFLLVLLFLSCVPVQAVTSASTTAQQVNTLFDKKTPYQVDLSKAQMTSAGFVSSNLDNPAEYKIIIKSAKYDEKTEMLVLNINAWRDGKSVKVNNPVHFYMPWSGGVKGKTQEEQLQNYNFILVRFLDGLPLGEPVNDDTVVIYTSNDGTLKHTASSEDWSTLRGAAGNAVSNNPTYPEAFKTVAHASTDGKYIRMQRYDVNFNASAIPSGATITSAIVRFRYVSKATTIGGQNETAIVKASPANSAVFVAGDYDGLNLASPTELASRFDFTSTTAGNVNFTLNSDGINELSSGGNLTLMLIDGDELDNSFTGVWVANGERRMLVVGASDATEANRPYIQVIYTPGAPADTTPPTSITGLTNTTGCSWIKWDWTNPTDSDFNHTHILKDNVFYTNLSNATTSSNWTSLSQLTEYTFSSHTCDITGNCNTTWVNGTSTTPACTTPTPTPTPAGNCSFLNVTGLSILQNSTNLSMSAGNSSWGISIINTTEGNISFYQCGNSTITIPTLTTTTIQIPRVIINPSVDTQPFFCRFSLTRWTPLCPKG